MSRELNAMARNGVSYSEVAEKATQLLAEGRNPSVERIRMLLGTGSTTTVANHLRQWKANQEATTLVSAKENIPLELVAVMKGLWERVNNLSEEKITALEENHQLILSALQQTVEKYKTNNQRWQKLLEQWTLEKNQLATEKLTLEQALEFTRQENASLHAKQDASLQQLQDKQERITELNRLQAQAQANLEHYRESTREQRLLDQQQHEHQNQQLQSEIKSLKEQLIMQREKMSVLQQQHQIKLQSYSILEKNHHQVEAQLEKTREKLEETENSKNSHFNASQHWQNQYNEAQKILGIKTNKLIASQTDSLVLSQQLTEIKQKLKNKNDQNTLLESIKVELSQEKYLLEGRLRQLQEMIAT
jgi:chromosome segregation ATPase